jgi:predicted dehydrogenase
MKKVRLGIVGMGNIGTAHSRNILAGKVPNVELTAVCDSDPAALAKAAAAYPAAKPFDRCKDLIASGTCEAVLIGTPHFDHPVIAMAAMEAGLDVLVEKPVAVDTKAAREAETVAKRTGRVYAVMFNERTNPLYIKAKELIDSGEIGAFLRVNWIVTHWYRTQYYYDSGGWRGSWGGEGGGVLMNQCPHQLDLLQWLCGMPSTVWADCRVGRYHDIEVEDDATLIMTWANGANGAFIANTGEAPGTNRLEIAGTQGRMIIEGDSLVLHKLRADTAGHIKTSQSGYIKPECWEIKVPAAGDYPAHAGVITAFANHILHGGKLIAAGVEGLNSLMLCNAAYLSAWTGEAITLPIDDAKYWKFLQEKIAGSRYKG